MPPTIRPGLDLVDLCPPALVPEDFKSVLEAYASR